MPPAELPKKMQQLTVKGVIGVAWNLDISRSVYTSVSMLALIRVMRSWPYVVLGLILEMEDHAKGEFHVCI